MYLLQLTKDECRHRKAIPLGSLQLGFEAKMLLNFAGMLDCLHQTLRKLELILIVATDDGRMSTEKCRLMLVLFPSKNEEINLYLLQLTKDECRHKNADDSPRIVATWF